MFNKIEMIWHYKKKKFKKELDLTRKIHSEEDILFHANLMLKSLIETMKFNCFLDPLTESGFERRDMLECSSCGSLINHFNGKMKHCECGHKLNLKDDNIIDVYIKKGIL